MFLTDAFFYGTMFSCKAKPEVIQRRKTRGSQRDSQLPYEQLVFLYTAQNHSKAKPGVIQRRKTKGSQRDSQLPTKQLAIFMKP